ncbi:MAG: SCO family protein [Bryobacteraceae bacterium]
MPKRKAAFAPTFCIFVSLIFVSLALPIATGCARRYRVDGLLLAVDRPRQAITVSHRTIPGFMNAMAMPFRVRDAREMENLSPGARIGFRLTVEKDASYIDRLRIRKADLDDDDLPLPKPSETVAIGEPVPDFTLTDQAGARTRLSDFQGKVLAVNFIYTRCPLPEVCPRLSANFSRLQRRFREQLGKDLILLSVTIDPRYDAPEVLSGYAKIWKADPRGWRFLTGDLASVESVARRFGMVYWPEEGLLTHTSQTGVIARDGTLAALVEGSGYLVNQLGDLIAAQLEASR